MISWFDLEDLAFEAKKIASATEAIGTAISHGDGNYEDAVWLISDLLRQHTAKIEKIFNDELRLLRTEKTSKQEGQHGEPKTYP